jgi:hypothetical protein
MVKDRRFKIVQKLIRSGDVKLLTDIFEVIPVTTVAVALGSNWDQLTKRIKEPGIFRINEIIAMAAYFEVEEKVMIDIIYNQVLANRGKKKRSGEK